MQNDLLSIADALPDRELLDRLPVLASNERAASVELVAHLAALEKRPSLYVAGAYRSLFAYCTEALRLSEDAAYTRVMAAQACRRFPQILDRVERKKLGKAAAATGRPFRNGEGRGRGVAAAARSGKRGQANGLGAGRRSVRLRLEGRSEVQRAGVVPTATGARPELLSLFKTLLPARP